MASNFFADIERNAAKKREEQSKSPLQRYYEANPGKVAPNSPAASGRYSGPDDFASAMATVLSSKATDGPAVTQTTTAPEAKVQPIQTPELDKATGNGWEDTQALGRELTPRMSASQILARNMSAAPEDVTPQMQAEYQKAAQAEREYKTRRRNAMAAGAQAVAEANPLFSADPDEVMRTGMPDIDNKGNTFGAFNRGLFGQSAIPEGMTETEQKLFQRGSKAQDVFVNAPAIIAEFGEHALDTFFRPGADHEANAYDPGIVQRASRAGDIVGLTTSTGLGKASNEIAEFVTMVEDAATGGRWRDPLNRAAMSEFDKLQGVVEDETKDWTAGQKKAFMYGSEAVRMVPSIVLAWMTGGTSTAASLGPEAAGRAAQFSRAFTRYVTGLAHDPQFYLTSMQVAGDSYASALEKGVDRNTAALFGTLNGVLNGAIEIGGMQDVPGLIRGTGFSNGLLQAILSIPTEIREEVMQGAVEKALENVVLGENNQFISVKDPDAIISLSRAVQEGEGAAIISALMGGGNVALNTALNVYNNAVQQQNPLTQTILANEQGQQAQGSEFNAPQAAESDIQTHGNTGAQEQVRTILNSTVSNSQAERILSNPALRAAFEEMSGVELTGTKSEQRVAVKKYAAETQGKFNIDNAESAPYTVNEGRVPNGSEGEGSEAAPGNGVQPVSEPDSGGAGERNVIPGNPGGSGGLRALSDTQRQTLTDSGIVYFDTEDVSGNNAVFSSALDAGKASQKFGPFVDSKNEEDLNGMKLFLAPDGAGGFAVRSDGDVEAVFTRRGVAPPHSAAGLVVGAVAQGGTKLDCYGIVLVNNYATGGFIPVAQVDWNQDYAPPGWTPELGTPQVYVMMHNGDSADTVAANFGQYKAWTQAELDALPRFSGETGYDNALSYRDMLLARQQEQQKGQDNQPSPPDDNTPPPAGPGGGGPTVRPAPSGASGTNLSASVETVQNSPVTSNEFSALIDKTVSEGGYRYIPITNNETTQRATQRIQQEGWERARANWTADVRSGKTSAEMMAVGALLYNNAVQAGDMKAAAEIMADYVAAGTNTAQALQARKIIQSMQPEMRLYMIDSTIARLSENLAKKLPDGITISQELRDEYMRATTDEQRDEIVARMQKEVADQIPSTFKDKWTALRYVNMLGNFRTQARNILGNTTMAAITSAKNAVQTLFESVASAATGGRVQRTTSLFANRDLVQAAREYYNANSDTINGEGKYSDNRTATGFMKGVEDQRRIFKTGIMEGYRRATNWAMTRGDTVFIGARFARTLAGYLQANGMDAATFSGIQNGSIEATAEQQALIDKAVNYATQEAQEATFHDNNTLSTWISQIGRKPGTPKFARLLSEGIMPFRKTPANVLIRAEEYSPLGFVNATVKAVQAAKGTNNVTANDVVNSLSKAVTGTGIFLLGMLLRNAGWLAGHEDDEKQKGFNDLQGEQEYALNLPGGKSITIDWMSPASVPLFLGVQMMDAVNDGGFELKDLEKVFTSITDPMIQMSMLQGVNDTLSNVKYAENNLVQVGLSSALSYLTQGLTNTMLGQLERTVEDRRTTTYVDKDSNLPAWAQRAIGKAAEKVPINGADFQQVEYLDAWGRPDMYEENGFARAFNNFVNPGYVSQTNSTEVDNELQRLYDAGMGNVFPQRISMSDKIAVYDEHGQKTGERQLTADEYVQVQREAGQTKLQMVKDLMALPMYEGMSDDAKADAISAIYQYANYEAIRKVEPSHEDKNAEIASLSNIPAYFAAREAYQDATANRWNRDYEELNNVLDSFDTLAPDVQKTLLEKDSQLRLVRDAYDAGMSTENWFKAYDATRDLTPYGDHKEVTDWQKYQAMANVSTDEDMDVMLRGYLEGSSYERYMAVRNEGVSARAWADAMAEAGKAEPLPGKDGVANWQKWQAMAGTASDKDMDAFMRANLSEDQLRDYTDARNAGITPQQWADTCAAVAQLPVLEGMSEVATFQAANYIGSSNSLSDREKDALMGLYLAKGKDGKMSTYEKYMACRGAGYAPVHLAKFLEFKATAGKKDDVIAAAVRYGFTEKNALALWNMFQSGHW